MKTDCNLPHCGCKYYTGDHQIEFRQNAPRKGDHYIGRDDLHHTLVFLTDGEIEFSYNDYLHRHFKAGDMFFLPQAAEMYGTALSDTRMTMLKFNNRVKSLCESCRFTDYSKDLASIAYDFKPLKITESIEEFVSLMDTYIEKGLKCSRLHALKQQELFILLGYEYSRRDLLEMFYPIAGGNLTFKSRVFEYYAKGLSVQELSAQFDMSYSAFLRKFKAEFGESTQEWMQKQKAKHIMLKLSIPSTTIADIVFEYNFSDTSHFTRYCRKQFNCTPSELIRSIRNLQSE